MLVTSLDTSTSGIDLKNTLRSHFRHWAALLGLVSADALAFAMAAALFRWWHPGPRIFIGGTRAIFDGVSVDVFSVLAVFFVVMRAFAGDYSRREPFWDGLRAPLVALIATSLPDLAAIGFAHHRYSIANAVGSWVFLLMAIPLARQGAMIALDQLGLWRRKTALIGSGPAAETAYLALRSVLSMGLDIQWLILPAQGAKASEGLRGLKRIFLENPQELGRLVQATGCEQAIVALDASEECLIPELTRRLSEASVETAIIPAMGGFPMGNLRANVLFGRNLLLFQTSNTIGRWPHRTFKRGFDVVAALVGIVVLAPFLAVLALRVKAQDGGPVFYAQQRIGRDGKPFWCLKFRTMSVDADARLTRWRTENPDLYEEFLRSYKLKDDPRVTPLGNRLRRSSLDELPQIFNILIGDMSFVGPRPVVERELVEFYGPAAQLYMRVRPGLTGLWQVCGRSDTSYDERIAFDEWYILNWSFWTDIVIIAQTFRAVLTGHGAV